jgi:hypothetical protein
MSTFKGLVSEIIYQMVGGLKALLWSGRYWGIEESSIRQNQFPAGGKKSHPTWYFNF